MHEAGIALNLITAAEEALGSDPAARVSSVTVAIGALTAVSPDALDFAFHCLSRGTRLEGARLDVESVPLTVRCDACGAATAVKEYNFRCGTCGSGQTRVATGRELTLLTLDVITEDGTDARDGRRR